MTATVYDFQPVAAQTLVEEVVARSGQPLTACYQCRRCAAGCPVGEETGYVTPDRLIRMIALGDRDQALNNALVWQCVSCFTCGTRCPNDIQTARITETLKKMAKEKHLEPLKPKVANFHDAFVKSGLRWGRVNEMEFMGFYELKNFLKDLKAGNFKAVYDEMMTQAKLGLDMFKHKRLHFGFLSAKGRGEIKRLFKKYKARKAA
jgi:heterodisulfide reductase subunit C2